MQRPVEPYIVNHGMTSRLDGSDSIRKVVSTFQHCGFPFPRGMGEIVVDPNSDDTSMASLLYYVGSLTNPLGYHC